MDELPVVDGFVAFFCRFGDIGTEMHGCLSDIVECCGVRDFLIDAPEFCGGVLHQVDASDGVDGRRTC